MNKTLIGILAALGILAIIYAIANWNRLFPTLVVNNGTLGRGYVSSVDEVINPISRDGKTVCKVTDANGNTIEITGDENNPEFAELCRNAQRRDRYPIYWYNQVYYPWVFVRPRHPHHTSTGTGSGTGTGTGTGTGISTSTNA